MTCPGGPPPDYLEPVSDDLPRLVGIDTADVSVDTDGENTVVRNSATDSIILIILEDGATDADSYSESTDPEGAAIVRIDP